MIAITLCLFLLLHAFLPGLYLSIILGVYVSHSDVPSDSEPGFISSSDHHISPCWMLIVPLLFLLSAKLFSSTAICSITKLTWSNGLTSAAYVHAVC